MRANEIITQQLLAEQVEVLSPQESRDRGYFGPVYHGTTPDRREKIDQEGFRILRGSNFKGERHGYQMGHYAAGSPPPLHTLGFGIYLTTVKAIAKQFADGSGAGLVEYWIAAPRLEVINFGSPNTMMRWWRANGYDFTWPEGAAVDFGSRAAIEERYRATEHMTEVLSSKFDAVWFKGKGIRRLLDGDQVCVYDPSRIYRVDPKLAKGLEVGARVIHTGLKRHADDPRWAYVTDNHGHTWETNAETGAKLKYIPPPTVKGRIVGVREIGEQARHHWNGATHAYEIKWDKGGTHYNYTADELEPVAKK